MAQEHETAGLGSMFDAVELMRRSWSGLNLPSSLQPTVDVAELDRRIADLRVVEQWLQMNQNLLQTTIQTLEIQRNTIAAFQAFSNTGTSAPARPFAAPATPPASAREKTPAGKPTQGPPEATRGSAAAAPSDTPANSIAATQAALWWEFLQQPFRPFQEATTPPGGSAPATPGTGTRHPGAEAADGGAGHASAAPPNTAPAGRTPRARRQG